MAAAGTLRSFTIEGVSFDVVFDVNVSNLLTQFENSKIPTSGPSMTKSVRRVPTAEGIVLITDAATKAVLRDFAEQSITEDVKFSYTSADGSVYKAVGTFNMESDETEENRTTIHVHPTNGWDILAA